MNPNSKQFLVTLVVSVLFTIQSATYGQICLDSQLQVPSGTEADHVAACDFNGDGLLDLASPNAAGTTALVMMNAGDGTFAAPVSYPIGADPDGIACADFDGVNGPDLAVTSSNNNIHRVSILLNNGNGTFQPQVLYTLGAKGRQVIATDLDGDNAPDLAIVMREAGTVATMLNNGTGTFAASVQHPVGVDPRWVIDCDIDSDTDRDLIVSNGDSGTVSVLVNQGSGSFAGQVTYATGQDPRGLACCDVDNDNDNDLVVATSNNNSLAILSNNGSGQFSAPVYWPVGADPDGVACCDLDADGLEDVIVSDNTLNSIYVLRNLGAGTFATPLPFAAGLEPSHVVCANMDGASGPDVVVANSADSIVSVFYNCAVVDQIISAEGMKLLDGVIVAGTMADLTGSDDQYLELDPFPTPNPIKQKVHLVLQSTSPTDVPTSFKFRLEAVMMGGPSGDVTQRIQLFNYNTGVPELVDIRAASNTEDSIQIDPGGDLSRFMNPLNNEITADIIWTSDAFTGNPFNWAIDVDEAVWLIGSQ